MCNLLEYSNNYCTTSGSLWNSYRNEVNDDENKNDNANNRINNIKTKTNKSFGYKTKIIGGALADNNTLNEIVVAPLKYLSYFLEISRFTTN